MTNRNTGNFGFQTFFVSREQSNCPLITDIIRISKKLKKTGLLDNTEGTISLGYGKRIIINRKNVGLGDVEREDIVEVVDYDPIKKIILAIGQKEPCIETPVHWLIHHARDDVNVVLQLNSEKLAQRLTGKLPVTEKDNPPGSLELAKEILKTLRKSKSIVIKDKGALFVGTRLTEVEELVLNIQEESK